MTLEESEVLIETLKEALETVRPHFEGEYWYDHPDNITIRAAMDAYHTFMRKPSD